MRTRRRYIVDRQFQSNLILRALAFQAFTILALGVGLFTPLLYTGTERAIDYERTISLLYMHENFWPVALGCLLLTAFAMLRVSHRIAGPLVRFKRNMRLVAEGHLPDALTTRDHDYLKDEVALLNQMVAGLAARIDELSRIQREIHGELSTCASHARLGETEAMEAHLDAALERVRELEERLGRFTRAEPAPPAPRPAAPAAVP